MRPIALSAAVFQDSSRHIGLRLAAGPRAQITLLDPADRLGGVLRTERVGGQPFDVGAEAFIVRRPEMLDLLAELGLAGRRLSPTGTRPLIYSGARLHQLPQGTLQGIPAQASSLLGLVDDETVARIHRRALPAPAVEPGRRSVGRRAGR